MSSLIEKAKAAASGRTFKPKPVSDEHMELALAWGRGEITQRQVAVALGKSIWDASGTYAFLANALRASIMTLTKRNVC